MKTINNAVGTLQHLAKVAVTRPETAVTTILTGGQIRQDLSALRIYPASLIALWRADNAPRNMRSMIEDTLHSVGMRMVS